jgi:hypothetical protein
MKRGGGGGNFLNDPLPRVKKRETAKEKKRYKMEKQKKFRQIGACGRKYRLLFLGKKKLQTYD